jgi:hypothetical protein
MTFIRTLREAKLLFSKLGITTEPKNIKHAMEILHENRSKMTVKGNKHAKPNFPHQDEPNSHDPKPLDPKNPKSPIAGRDIKSMSTPELVDHYDAEVSRLAAEFKAVQATDPRQATVIQEQLKKAQKNHAYASHHLTSAEKSARKLHNLLEE